MPDMLEAVKMGFEVAELLEPVLRKNRLKGMLEKKGKTKQEAKVYIMALDLLKSAYVDRLVIEPAAVQLATQMFIEIVKDDDLARAWFKDRRKIDEVRRLISA